MLRSVLYFPNKMELFQTLRAVGPTLAAEMGPSDVNDINRRFGEAPQWDPEAAKRQKSGLEVVR